MTKFATQTSVSVEKSRAEIEATVRRYGADGFVAGWEGSRAMVRFRCAGRYVRFIMTLPDPNDKRFTEAKVNQFGAVRVRAGETAQSLWEQACRSLWRALLLLVKAKLEAVESGIVTFEEEFFGNIVMPDGATVYERAAEQVRIEYDGGKVAKMLPDYSAASH